MRAPYDFIAKARAVHDERYDYSQSVYIGRRHKVIVVCREHGQFEQRAGNHLSGAGCPACALHLCVRAGRDAGQKASTAYDFIAKARAVHGDRYDYSMARYNGSDGLVTIVCREHGQFEQRACVHLKGSDCPKCGRACPPETRLSLERFAAKARAVHGDRYDYLAVEAGPSGKTTIATIRCKTHGEFKQVIAKHLYAKRGCLACYRSALSHDTPSFITKAARVHGGRYDYSLALYVDAFTALTVICHKHGSFAQTPHVHLRLGKGAGCPRCHDEECTSSTQEITLREWLATLTEVRANDRTVLRQYEVDVWMPEHKTGVEFHGLYWHSERHKDKGFHQRKYVAAATSGIRLIQIFEDEWRLKPELVKSMILAKIGMSPSRIFARKCRVTPVSYQDGRAFFEANHLQGADSSRVYYGLIESGRLVACLSLTFTGATAKIQRFACLSLHSVPGGFSRLLKAFLREHLEIRRVETYANLRYSDGQVYKANGFIDAGITPPGYFYVRMGTKAFRESRQRYQLHKLKKLGYVGTERSITAAMKLTRIYDAGHMRLSLSV